MLANFHQLECCKTQLNLCPPMHASPRRYKGGVPKAVVSALEAFPNDPRVRCEGVLTVQNLSLTAGGARAMTKAGVAPVIVRMLRGELIQEDKRTLAAGTDETVDGEHFDRNGKNRID